jgi:hypothetical protein
VNDPFTPDWRFAEPVPPPRRLTALAFAFCVLATAAQGYGMIGESIHFSITIFGFALSVANIVASVLIQNCVVRRSEVYAILACLTGGLTTLVHSKYAMDWFQNRMGFRAFLLISTCVFLSAIGALALGWYLFSIRKHHRQWSYGHSYRDRLGRWAERTVRPHLPFESNRFILHFHIAAARGARKTKGIRWRLMNWIDLAKPGKDGTPAYRSLPTVVGDRHIVDWPVARLAKAFVFGTIQADGDPLFIDGETLAAFRYSVVEGTMQRLADTFEDWMTAGVGKSMPNL